MRWAPTWSFSQACKIDDGPNTPVFESFGETPRSSESLAPCTSIACSSAATTTFPGIEALPKPEGSSPALAVRLLASNAMGTTAVTRQRTTAESWRAEGGGAERGT